MNKLRGVLEALKLYGFIVINEDQKELIDHLKAVGVIHMFNIRRLGSHTILELNLYGCEKECELHCRDGSGLVSSNCLGECVDACAMEKLDAVAKILARSST